MVAGELPVGGVHQDNEGTYQWIRGGMRNSLVVVQWNLTDTGGKHGGLLLWPGSHKARPNALLNSGPVHLIVLLFASERSGVLSAGKRAAAQHRRAGGQWPPPPAAGGKAATSV